MGNGKYILVDKKPVLEPDVYKWGQWIEKSPRHVGQDDIGDARVSTVFLGLDHSFITVGAPVLFETMVFGGKFDEQQERYRTYEEAEEGHKRWVTKIAEGNK